MGPVADMAGGGGSAMLQRCCSLANLVRELQTIRCDGLSFGILLFRPPRSICRRRPVISLVQGLEAYFFMQAKTQTPEKHEIAPKRATYRTFSNYCINLTVKDLGTTLSLALTDTMPKSTTTTLSAGRRVRRHNPLSDDLVTSGPLRTRSKKRKSGTNDVEGDSYVDAKSSRRILEIGQALAEEERNDYPRQVHNAAFAFDSRFGGDVESEEEEQSRDDDDTWGDDNLETVEEIVRPEMN